LFVSSLDFSLEEGDSLFLFLNKFGESSGVVVLGGSGFELSRGGAFDGDVSGAELDSFGFTALSAEPFVGSQSGFAGEGRGVKIVLEDVGFAWDGERDGLDGGLVDFEETSDFTRGGVEAGLGEHGHTTLRVVGFVFRQVEDIRIFVDGFEISDVTVSLTGEEKDVGVIIVKGHEDTRTSVDILSVEGGGKGSGVPDGELAFAGFGEAEGEELFLATEIKDSASLDTGMSLNFAGDSASSGVDQTDLLVL